MPFLFTHTQSASRKVLVYLEGMDLFFCKGCGILKSKTPAQMGFFSFFVFFFPMILSTHPPGIMGEIEEK
jgi:hypothetical protein